MPSTPISAGRWRARLCLEELEPRRLLAGYQPTAVEQVFLERLNDARANPPAYGASIGLDLSGVASAQPLAFDTRLIQAARDHAQDMNDRAYFSHYTPEGLGPGERMSNAGFAWTSYGESIAAGYSTPESALAGFIIDEGVPSLGHRKHLLAMEGYFQSQKQVGIGIVQNGSGPYRHYYAVDSASSSDTRPILTGVAFNDANQNSKYDAGEGLAGVTVTVSGLGSVSTWGSGGYSFSLNPGTYTVTASGAGLGTVTRTVTVGTSNYRLNFNPSTSGPRILSSSPSGELYSPSGVSSVRVTFDNSIQPTTFTPADVVQFTGPSGSIPVTAVTVVAGSSNRQFDLTFATQSALGAYTLVLGPNISDSSGRPMDQNGNGTNGENPADRFSTSFTLVSAAAAPRRFDFGTATSPVAAGYTQVTPATTYNTTRGHGWQSGVIDSRDYGTGTDLTRDLNFTTQGTFAVDLPNGSYQVTLTLGNALWAKEQMGVFLEGGQVDSVNAAVGQVVTRAYTVTVSDGQLTLLLRDLGGDDPYVVLNGLDIVPAGDTTGPRVVSASPIGNVSGPVTRITLTFSEAIQDGTFTLADVVSLIGPAGAITATAVNKLSATQYEVVFPSQTAPGTYSLTVGPDIRDLANNLMDQNQNGSKGEAMADRFSTTLTLVATSGFTARFDFGTATSPVAAGYTRVTPSITYNTTRGYGWQSGVIDSRDYGNGTDLTRDLNFTTQGTFAADLPNGSYRVTLNLGNALWAKEQMGVFLEGSQVDSVNAAAGQVVTRTYIVTVNDGQLTLLLRDFGGADPYVVINGLDIIPAASAFTARFDFGTASSPVAAGYTQVTPTTTYNTTRGYGWQSGVIDSRDYGNGMDLTRDLNFTTQGTFAVDLPNGSYQVTLTLGNALWAKEQMGVFLEGSQVDSVNAAVGQVVTRTYTVTVSDGQLTLLLRDLGGDDPYVVINGLEIIAL